MLEETAEEKAYFESRGKTEIPDIKEETVDANKVSETASEKPSAENVEKQEKDIPFVPEVEDKPGFVPKEALGEARRTNKELREELNAFREKAAKMEVAYQNILQKIQPQEKPLTYSDDPDTFIKKFVEETQQTVNSIKESREQDAQRQEFANAIITREREFVAKNPEYNNAVEFWKEKRLAQLAFTIQDPAERQKILNDEATWIGSQALRQNMNPAEVIYNMAQVFGWKPNTKPDATSKIQTIAKGQERSTNVPGETPPGVPNSLEELAKLPDDEFDKHFDRIMGKKPGSGLFN